MTTTTPAMIGLVLDCAEPTQARRLLERGARLPQRRLRRSVRRAHATAGLRIASLAFPGQTLGMRAVRARPEPVFDVVVWSVVSSASVTH